jgi:hypothetical protein
MADTKIDGRMIFQQTSNADSEGVNSIHLAVGDCGGLCIYNVPSSSIICEKLHKC